ncbi:MAG: cysteine--tRNA ligase [Candidatus Harrisonbacteria bacterium CG10_big_fil_rev_8_21_14_0_10_40_38]|uniref:Cysteine--tRNA ligase n=1 Tax=Candidatus Harrisonbacteria bacterium CG10_big_fil_rev_8_21_14_0_10_40_38 TaxID=1974583 RepID=A0A2H0USY5_9BACT|nr:MAG: cysteine--tRNA ligase [Candidatus Harrisonbacteria bacterium CG10_big_fil_rev_8_21_14_0_10_40_38]
MRNLPTKIHIQNTLTGKETELPIWKNGITRLFVCGPTVYDRLHIGNARTYASFDNFVKFLRYTGIKVRYIQNITDIDDKIIKKAEEEKTTPEEIAQKYTKIFKENMRALDITSVDKYLPATDYIQEIISQVERLIEKNYAYKIEKDLTADKAGGYYFDLSKFPDYGKLAGRTIEQAEDGVSRIDENENKKNRGDFCLWKFPKTNLPLSKKKTKKPILLDGEPVWWAPFGWGRPGWHIEDTAISEKELGPQYEIHGGGRDLIFPHHEAEIAEQESVSGKKPFVQLWMHTGLMTVEGKKMSKSLGNFITVDEFLKNNDANLFRLIVAMHHYRSAMDISERETTAAKEALNNIKEFFAKLDLITKKGVKEKNEENLKTLISFEEKFVGGLTEDLNTPKSLAAVFESINKFSQNIWKLNKLTAKNIKSSFENHLKILGIKIEYTKPDKSTEKIIKEREIFRNKKEFSKSDELRRQIEAKGYKIDDTPLGPLVYKN